MSTADTAEPGRAEQARAAANARWGNQVVTRAAAIVIERAAQLDDSQRAAIGAAITEGGTDE